MEPKILGVGPRTAAYLRVAYPKSRAKLIARDFRVSTGTAERERVARIVINISKDLEHTKNAFGAQIGVDRIGISDFTR